MKLSIGTDRTLPNKISAIIIVLLVNSILYII